MNNTIMMIQEKVFPHFGALNMHENSQNLAYMSVPVKVRGVQRLDPGVARGLDSTP